MITAFVSYVGSFTKRYRVDLFENHLMPFLKGLKYPVPVSEGLDPLTMLVDDADIAGWNNEGLPSDRMSTENATILCNCERWPLMIDPQLQGIKWIKTRYGADLKVMERTRASSARVCFVFCSWCCCCCCFGVWIYYVCAESTLREF